MNKRAINIGLLYSAAVIVFKLIILLGGYTLSRFGFYYSHIVSALVIIPFFFLAIYLVREKDGGGYIGGKEGVRVALTVLAVSTIVLSIYNYVEFTWKYKDISIAYYQSEEYLNILKEQQALHPDKLSPEKFPTIIREQIASLSASKFVTGKLFSLLIVGLSGAFIAAVFMKRSPKVQS